MKSDTNGRMLNARYGVDGLRTKKQDADGNSSREYGVGISTSASTPLTQNSTAPSISYISGHMILGAEINGEFVYHLGDALSTVRDVVDDEGDVIRSNEWDEYGNLISSSGTGTASPKTWVGGLSVNDDTADSGMFNMGHRNYAATLGRFISRDPIGHAGGLNLYSYAENNPVNFVDPEGLNPLGAAVRIMLPAAVAEYLEPTIRQSNLLGDGTGGTVRYTEDGKLVILVSGDESLTKADKINILANECAHYLDLQLRGKPSSLDFYEAQLSEGLSDLLETAVGTVIPPNHPTLRAKQQRVRDTFKAHGLKNLKPAIQEIILDAGYDHGLDPFLDRNVKVPIKTGLPEDCR